MSAAKAGLSIRTILWLVISALTLLIVLLVTHEVFGQWQKLQQIKSLKSAVSFSDNLFDAIGKLDDERNIAFAMLHAPANQNIADLQTRLTDKRREVDAAFDSAEATKKTYEFPELDDLWPDIDKHLAAIKAMRGEIDASMTVADAQKRDALADRWYGEVTSLATATQDFWTKFVQHFTEIDPIITRLLRYEYYLRIIDSYTGYERALVGRRLIDNTDFPAEEVRNLLRWQGTIELSWKSAHILADKPGVIETIGPTFKDAESQYLNMRDMMKDIFYVPGAGHGASYPIDVNLWFELSADAGDALTALEKVSRQVKQTHIDQLETDGERNIAVHFVVLLAAIGLCGFCFWTIRSRVTGPIKAIIEALVDATQGKPVSFLPSGATRQDEVGKLATVLHVLQQKVEETKHYITALENSNRNLEDFAYIASHDLKEPLHGISKNASFLMDDYKEKLDETGVQRLRRLSTLAQRMEQLITDLLYFSRLGQGDLAIQKTDLNRVVYEIQDMMDAFLKEHNARITVPEEMPSVVCDKPRITEVLRNLITNAVKYNDKPERIIEVGFRPEIATKTGPEKNVIYVKDNGIGIPAQFYDEIFRLFKKLQSTPENDKSTGVGLTFVKKIVERHQGRVWLDSEPGKGSTFYFTIGKAA